MEDNKRFGENMRERWEQKFMSFLINSKDKIFFYLNKKFRVQFLSMFINVRNTEWLYCISQVIEYT